MTEHELDTLLRDYGGAVRSVCRAILPGHPQDAEEAEADTFYKLWRGAHPNPIFKNYIGLSAV